MTNLSKQIGDAMIARLQSSFNSNMATVAAAYGIPAVTADFTVGNGQFFRGKFQLQELEDENPGIVYPVVALYVQRAVNLRRTKPAMFAGDIDFGLDFTHAFDIEDESGANDYESLLDATLETLVRVFNTGVTFPAPISYCGILEEAERTARRISNSEKEYTRTQRFGMQFSTRM